MEQLYQTIEACRTYLEPKILDSTFVVDTAQVQPCYELANSLHLQPYLLGGVPYPLIYSVLNFVVFHGVMLLLTKIFTLGL